MKRIVNINGTMYLKETPPWIEGRRPTTTYTLWRKT